MDKRPKWIFGASGLGKDMMYAMSTIMSIYLIDYVGIGSVFVGTIWGIRVLMFVLPIFGLLFSRYIFNKHHIIGEKAYSNILAQLKVRRGDFIGETNA